MIHLNNNNMILRPMCMRPFVCGIRDPEQNYCLRFQFIDVNFHHGPLILVWSKFGKMSKSVWNFKSPFNLIIVKDL